MVLLLAMMLAMAAGLMAYGPVPIVPADHLFADQRTWLGMAQGAQVVACLPLVAVGAWGAVATLRSSWPSALRMPWLLFFVLCVAMSVVNLAYHLSPGDVGFAFTHLFAAAALTALALGFMAERVDALFGSAQAVAGGLGVAGFAALWWFAGQWASGEGDMRALLFLESLPLLLIPAGALSLPGRHTSTADWIAMLVLYLVARVAGMADAAVYSATGWISGHTAMHLLLAAVAACLAYRAGVAPGSRRASDVESAVATQRSTSLTTSS
ncbi:MAG TPA: hypothetical protein VF169_24470 [Albitalea sp.]|uniref:hypothetical protein n=1 Tax=Piscinibacter sp. TaxID=1903157 RepID=UPI002ED16DC5